MSASLNNEITSVPSDMVAENTEYTPNAPPLFSATNALTLVNTAPTDKTPVPTTLHPEHHWNGRRETLGSWLAEFETVLSTTSPEVHEFAVEFFASSSPTATRPSSSFLDKLPSSTARSFALSTHGATPRRLTPPLTRSPTPSSPRRISFFIKNAVSVIPALIRAHRPSSRSAHLTPSTTANTLAPRHSCTAGKFASAT